MSEQKTQVSRRAFVGAAAAVGAGLAGAALPVRAGASPRARKVGANDTIVLGLIGCGGMGAVDMRALMDKPGVAVAALCDVDKNRMPNDIRDVTAKYGKAPAVYGDYRKMLERKDIDAIIVGTPDHWHALNLIHAVEAGKDVYCEKPISHDITEAKSMAAAVKRYQKIVQVGTWQRSTPEFTNAIAYVRAGKLGRVVVTRAWMTDTAQVGNVAPSTPPPNLDYDFWTGPAAMIPYAPNHVHGNWRWFLNYGTGMTGDWGVHMMDICLLGMSKDTDLVMPTEVTSYGGKLAYPDDGRTAPDTFQTIMRFKDPDFVLHWQNWLDCVRSREQPRSNLASMAQTTIVCHLANASMLAGETVRWSKERMDIVGRAGKNTQSYYREYRKPWKLPIYKE